MIHLKPYDKRDDFNFLIIHFLFCIQQSTCVSRLMVSYSMVDIVFTTEIYTTQLPDQLTQGFCKPSLIKNPSSQYNFFKAFTLLLGMWFEHKLVCLCLTWYLSFLLSNRCFSSCILFKLTKGHFVQLMPSSQI